MNMGQTLAAQAAVCREEELPFVFPGSDTQWNGVTDMTDAGLLAEQMHWAAVTPAAADTAFNVANGGRLPVALDVAAPRRAPRRPPRGATTPTRVPSRSRWPVPHRCGPSLAARELLRERDLDRVASWWHTDGDLGRDMECFTDLARSRAAGFTGHRSTLACFLELFDGSRRTESCPRPVAHRSAEWLWGPAGQVRCDVVSEISANSTLVATNRKTRPHPGAHQVLRLIG